MNHQALTREDVHKAVTATYGKLAKTAGKVATESSESCCAPTCCSADPLLPSDYLTSEMNAVPPGAYLGAGSGAPVRFAGLKAGEVVVDLGAGAGMDSFLAANAVGRTGRVWGFDLTPEMLERARTNAVEGGYANVSFNHSDIERLPLAAETADAAISNCVINLAPDKSAVYREIHRVLKPGGRLSIADIVLRGSDEAVAAFRNGSGTDTWCACVSGALHQAEYLETIRAAGFSDVRIVAERPAKSQPGNGLRAQAVTITAHKPVQAEQAN